MKVRPRMSVMNQLSDIQYLMTIDKDRANKLLNYCKAVLIKYDDLDEYVESSELDSLWKEINEKF